MIERMERQHNSTLKIANKGTSSIQTIWEKDDMIDIERRKGIIMKEIEKERQKDNLIDILEILFVINAKNMDILKSNVVDIIKLLNKSVN